MASNNNDAQTAWMSVIARGLAFLCLHVAELRDKDLAPQAALLEGLGLSRREAAKMLGTSEDSLRVLQRRAKRAKTGKGAKRAKAN